MAKISNVHLYRSLSIETMEFSIPHMLTDPKKWETLVHLGLFGPLLFGLHLKDMRRAYQIQTGLMYRNERLQSESMVIVNGSLAPNRAPHL